ncbi:MAG: efflux RND transporter periplasmic adaptor subunit [Tannerellaceae bacterium]|jgi:RND family efflux transporter MFP subunit|nr:efflux RND transporter periplasmic adaptor subunit [Tannerellaceae bacterium]
MKSNILIYFIPALLFFYGCKNSARAPENVHEHEHAHSGHCHNHNHEEEDEHEDDEIIFTKEQAEAAGLKVEPARYGKFSSIIKTGGQILAAQGDEATVVSTANGIVSFGSSAIIEGAYVRKGDAIVIVSSQNLPDGDPVVKAKIAYETAASERQRAETLVNDKIISAKDYEQIVLRYETAKTVYEAQAMNATTNGIKMISPINGYIKNRRVNQGEYVSVGQEVVTISQNRRLQLRAEVPESYFKSLRGLKTANFKAGYDDVIYKLGDLNGRLVSFGKTQGAESFYIPVIFEFDNTVDIIPGTFVEVYLLSDSGNDVLTVPVSALIEEQGLRFVYLQLDDEGYKKQEVGTGQDDGERIEILSGISEGDKIVTHGVYQVKLASISSAVPEGHTHAH